MKEFWDERYSAEEYIYGEEPSEYFRQVIDGLPPGKVLIPGAGEGRDAVYAARLGWEVHAFDQSEQGKKKAAQLAMHHNISLNYMVSDAADFDPGHQQFDLIALVFFHLPPKFRTDFHRRIVNWLRPGGKILVEAFHPRQLNNQSGGPKDPSLLITAAQLAGDFRSLEVIENTELTVDLDEGTHHRGQAEVVRFLGKKPNQTHSI
jgi:2-polyprenyl-3-methyl-5-hydroxy-6-metoxy-1,4-benzoquinol methylase